MKNWIRSAAFALVAAATTLPAQQTPAQGNANATTAPARWLTVNYTRVEAGNIAEYEKLIQSELAKVARARVDAGEIDSWMFQRAVLPAGQDAEYTHTTVVLWKDKPVLNAGDGRIDKTYAKAGVDRAAYTKKRNALGAKLVRTHIVRRIDTAGSPPQVGDFVRIDPKLVNPSDSREYVELERTVYKPNHEQRIKNGAVQQWSLFSIFLPGGPDGGYNFATVETFKNEEQLFSGGGRGPRDPSPSMRNTQARMNTIAQQKSRRVHRVLAIVR